MNAKDRSRFDIDALRELAGDKAFARGEAYHRGGQVEIQAVKLVARMAALRGAAEQTAYVAALKERFGRKRNVMKLLG